jgi:diguanylate cyclase (GGDEF)-like protein
MQSLFLLFTGSLNSTLFRRSFLVLLSLCPSAWALNPDRQLSQAKRQQWTMEDGLISDGILDLAQDHRGMLWIATYEGINQFDGKSFQRYVPPPPHRHLEEELATGLLCDAQGTLWVTLRSQGLAAIDPDQRNLTLFGQEDGLPNMAMKYLLQDQRGRLWVAGTGVFLLNTTPSGERHFDPIPINTPSSNRRLSFLEEDVNGILWLGLKQGGLFRFDGTSFEPFFIPDVAPQTIYNDLLVTPSGIMLLGTASEGLIEWDGTNLKRSMKSDDILTLMQESPQTVLVGGQRGLIRRMASQREEREEEKLDESDGLKNQFITCLLVDAEDNLWVGTHRGGLVRLSNRLFFTLSKEEGLCGKIVNAVLACADGDLWVGTDNGISVIREHQLVDHWMTKATQGLRVRHLHQDAAQTIWMATFQGLMRVEQNQLRVFKEQPADNLCRVVLRDSQGTLWVGMDNGLCILDAHEQLQPLKAPSALANGVILGLFEDPQKRLWVMATNQGLHVGVNGTFSPLLPEDPQTRGTWFNAFALPDGTIGFAGDRGLGLYRDHSFVLINKTNGLPQNQVFDLCSDDTNGLWLTHTRGISKGMLSSLNEFFRYPNLRYSNHLLDTLDGLRGGATPVSKMARDAHGWLWIPTLDGVAALDPGETPQPPKAFPPQIQKVRSDGKEHPLTQAIVLEPGTQRMEIAFTAANLTLAQRHRFRNRLLGFNRSWSDWNTQREESFTNLRPGTYTFELQSMNHAGVVSATTTRLQITQRPTFVQTLWFWITIGLLLLILALLLYRWRTRGLILRQLILEEKVKEQTEALRLANEHLSRLSLTDDLTQVANRRHFDEALFREWQRHKRTGNPLALMMIDLDFFKSFNDFYGHPTGDHCLQEVAKAMQERMKRTGDLLARYGGEEFAVIMPNTDLHGAATLATGLQQAVAALNLPHEGSPLFGVVTLSIGVCAKKPSSDTSPQDLIEQADLALYRAKHEGRNRICLCEPQTEGP